MEQFNPFGDQQPAPAGAAPQPQQQQQSVPPASPEHQQQRVDAWTAFLASMKEDPNARNALMTFGTQLLAGKQRGQSSVSHFANSAQNSMSYLQQSRLDDKARLDADANREIAQDKVRADTDQVKATTNEVAPNSASTRGVQGARETRADAQANTLDALRPGAVTGQEVLQGVAQQNANTGSQNANTNATQVANQNNQSEDMLQFRYEQLSAQQQIELAKVEATLRSTGKLPAEKIQMINNELAAMGKTRATATPEDIQEATNTYWRKVMALGVGNNLSLAAFDDDPSVAGNMITNINQAAGIEAPATPDPRQADAEASAAALPDLKGIPHTVEPAGNGTFNIIVNGKAVGTVVP